MSDIQKKLTRVQPPRVKLLYEIEKSGGKVTVELIKNIGVIANLTDQNKGFDGKKFNEVDVYNFDPYLKSLGISVDINVKVDDKKTLVFNHKIEKLSDLEPLSIIQSCKETSEIWKTRCMLNTLKNKILSNRSLSYEGDKIIQDEAFRKSLLDETNKLIKNNKK